jgi:ketosteroid isomerase-like protein
MSEENVELVRKVFEYWNRGDFEAFMDFSDDDQIIRTAEGWPERVVYGKDAVRSFYEAIAETVGHDSVIDDPIDAGDSVVVRVRTHMIGEHSGLEGQMEYSLVLTFKRRAGHFHFLERRVAAGLSEFTIQFALARYARRQM